MWGWTLRRRTLVQMETNIFLVFPDYLTKWPEVFPVNDRFITTVVKCLAELVWKHGVPAKIIHDRAAVRCAPGHSCNTGDKATANVRRTSTDGRTSVKV